MALLLKAAKIVGACLLVLACIGTLAAVPALVHFWLFARLPAKTEPGVAQFFVPPRTGAYAVARVLESNGAIRDARLFYLLAWFRSSLHRLQAGEYAFPAHLTPDQVLDQIINGRVVIHTATFPEGSTLWDVARVYEQKELAPASEIVRLAKDPELTRSLGISANTLEGYLFPESYRFKRPIEAAGILRAMVNQFWRHLPPDWNEKCRNVGLNLHQLVTLASIVEKEAVIDSERAVIAGVFYNRLKISMPLQSDPTSVYDIPGFSGPITATHLGRSSPYNTYRIKGLPPGPICSPGSKSLHAALNPERVPYLYFVSNNDGSHHFSTTLDEHNRAVGRYREMRTRTDVTPPPKQAPGAAPTGENLPETATERAR